MKHRHLLFLFSLPVVVGFGPFKCSDEAVTWRSNTFKTRDLSREPAETRLPKSLWEKIEDLGRSGAAEGGGKAGGHGGGGGGGGHGEAAPTAEHGGGGEGHGDKESHKANVATAFAPLKVYLVEKNPGILRDGHTEIDFGPGGGEIDLRDLVEPHNGSFYFIAEFLPDVKDIKRNVFFLSGAKQRKIDGQVYGAGCKSYLNVSTAFEKAAQTTGFLVNTTEGRHIAALAGTYFFAASHEGKLHLASLTIKDDGHRELQCPPLKEPGEAAETHEDGAHGDEHHDESAAHGH